MHGGVLELAQGCKASTPAIDSRYHNGPGVNPAVARVLRSPMGWGLCSLSTIVVMIDVLLKRTW